MSSEIDLVTLVGSGLGGAGVGGIIISLLKSSAARNIQAIDDRFKDLAQSLERLAGKVENLIDEVHRYNTQLTALTKDVGYLMSERDKLSGKIEGLQDYWRRSFAEHAKQIHDDFERHREAVHDWKNETIKHVVELAQKVAHKDGE